MEASGTSASSSPLPSWIGADAPGDVGLAGLRQHLDRVVERQGLRSLTVVVDDPDLGRQAFRAGAGPVEPGTLSAGTGVLADPPSPGIDADLLVALCAASLRVDVLRDTADVTGELDLRRLPGVFAVEIEQDGDLTICRVHVSADAPADVGRVAARTLATEEGSRLVVEVVRTTVASTPPTPATAPAAPDEQPSDAAPVMSLLAVRSVPEDGEVEVHLAVGDARAVGRAPLSRGLAGAVEAVLAAATQVAVHAHWRPSWVRTVETTSDGRFVVAAALVEPHSAEQRHGIARGSSPIEAAARATVGALS
ncbi:MAG TPA: hypothetical protein VIH82_06600 [Acidimicrobiia bacterium]